MIIELPFQKLLICEGLLILIAFLSYLKRYRLEKDLLIGSLRTIFQLYLLGFVLKIIFDFENPIATVLFFLWMVTWAGWTVRQRIGKRPLPFFQTTFLSMLLTYSVLLIFITQIVIEVKPWYHPQYWIPIGGMIIGNSMNSVAISLERFFSLIELEKADIEARLCLGASPTEAISQILQTSLHSGLIPTLNMMMVAGVVSIPGMMTGQILSGNSPESAVKYQIMIILVIAVSAALGSFVSLKSVARKCFDERYRLNF